MKIIGIVLLSFFISACAMQRTGLHGQDISHGTGDVFWKMSESIQSETEISIANVAVVNKTTSKNILEKFGLPYSIFRVSDGSYTYRYFHMTKSDEEVGNFLLKRKIRHEDVKTVTFDFDSKGILKRYIYEKEAFGKFNKYELMDQNSDVVIFIDRQKEFENLKTGAIKGSVFRKFGAPDELLVSGSSEIWKYSIPHDNLEDLISRYKGNAFFNLMHSDESLKADKRSYNASFKATAHAFIRLVFKNNKLVQKDTEIKDWLNDEEVATVYQAPPAKKQ